MGDESRTAAVDPASPRPARISPEQQVPDGDWLAAWRAGKLTALGAPAPPPRAPRDRRGMPW